MLKHFAELYISDTCEISSYWYGRMGMQMLASKLLQIKVVHLTISDVVVSGTEPFSFCPSPTHKELNLDSTLVD